MYTVITPPLSPCMLVLIIIEMDNFDSFPTSFIKEPTAFLIDRELAAVPEKNIQSDVYVHAKSS